MCSSACRTKLQNSTRAEKRIEVRWVDTLKSSGIHRSRLKAKEFGGGSEYEGFANFSAPPPQELVRVIISMIATAQKFKLVKDDGM